MPLEAEDIPNTEYGAPLPNYGTVTKLPSKERSLEEIYEELGFGWAQCLIWAVLMLAAVADFSQMFVHAILIPSIRQEWELSLPFTVILVSSVYFCYGLGGLVCGMLSDKFGRCKVLMVSTGLLTVTGTLSAIAVNKWQFLGFQATGGFCIGASMTTAVVYSAEITSSAYKEIGPCLISVMGSFSTVMVGISTFLVLNAFGWRALVMVSTSPAPVALIFLCMLPESPRYLVASGSTEEASKTIQKYFKLNRKTLPEGTTIKTYKNVERGNMGDLLKPEYFRETILLSLMNCGNVLIAFSLIVFLPLALQMNYYNTDYYDTDYADNGIVFNTSSVDQVLTQGAIRDLTIVTLSGFLGVLAGITLVKTAGRVRAIRVIAGASTLFGASLFIFVNGAATIANFCLLQFLVMCLNVIMNVIITEFYPTAIRSTGSGFLGFWAKFSGVIGTGLVYVLVEVDPELVVAMFLVANVVVLVCSWVWNTETRHTVLHDV